MSNSASQTPVSAPVIAIDLKQNRIRIHKGSLHLLGNPEYVQFLVNPTKRNLILIPSINSDHLAHHIRWYTDTVQRECCFYSKDLTHEICGLAINWDEDSTYRLVGRYISSNNALLFSLKDSYKVDLEMNNG